MRSLCKHLVSAALVGALSLTVPLAGHAAKTIRFGHDNKADMTENPAQAFTGVFANLVKSSTNGEVTVEVFPNNQLGSAKEHIQMVRDGIIQGTLASVGALASYYPRIGVLNLPFAFDDISATYEVFDGKFGRALAADIEEKLGNVKVLGFPDTGGFFSITNSVRPIESLEDFEGIRIRTMTLPAHQKLIQSLGGEAYPLAWGEVYSALQTGAIDGQMNPVPTVSFAKFDEVQDYLTLTNHLFSPYILLINRDFYDSLTEHQQNVLRAAARSGIAASRGMSRIIEASEDRGLAGLSEKMEVNALSPDVREKFREVAQPAVRKYLEDNLDEQGQELLKLFIEESQAANNDHYLQ
ncbi:TRAP transporter substrate-binding protein DctP [Marinobacter nanhaiticus D15-8W]|uniref:TRAP transporter substrate-binding protein DctP n=1 Tax=Marinobacter nanhaiticus D15-8W TaxID=626887 RepID=N6WPC9_9GAMM|nr:DctP family TRAP transporter solute-binding subunit [Marinobacter nanhaiticus]ENO12922.1 TRAP transporter substrate-binding protein DctP [Marinobacter nanhaiticus D15-8W]BES70273.1 TRAP transporter substrate-binding protein DctP [Marinobacter nanhaiticus D15-8W]